MASFSSAERRQSSASNGRPAAQSSPTWASPNATTRTRSPSDHTRIIPATQPFPIVLPTPPHNDGPTWPSPRTRISTPSNIRTIHPPVTVPGETVVLGHTPCSIRFAEAVILDDRETSSWIHHGDGLAIRGVAGNSASSEAIVDEIPGAMTDVDAFNNLSNHRFALRCLRRKVALDPKPVVDVSQLDLAELEPTPIPPPPSWGSGCLHFWRARTGHQMIANSPGAELSDWLAKNFSNLYGNLAGKSNEQVYQFFIAQSLHARGEQPVQAATQIMCTALAVYFDAIHHFARNIAPGNLATLDVHLGPVGKAFNAPDDSDISVLDALKAVNAHTVGGRIQPADRRVYDEFFANLNELIDLP